MAISIVFYREASACTVAGKYNCYFSLVTWAESLTAFASSFAITCMPSEVSLFCCYLKTLLYLVQISEHIEGATVYLDAGCTESFQILGAYPLLLELGVHAVCSLEDMSHLDMVLIGYTIYTYMHKCIYICSASYEV